MSAADGAWFPTCAELAVDSYRLIDLGRAADTAALFAEDAQYVTPLGTMRGRAQIASAMAKRQADTARRTRHVLGSHSVRSIDASTAEANFVLTVYVLSDPDDVRLPPSVLADVTDRYAMDDGHWRIAHRTLDVVATRA